MASPPISSQLVTATVQTRATHRKTSRPSGKTATRKARDVHHLQRLADGLLHGCQRRLWVWRGRSRAGFEAMRNAMPMKISDFTSQMQTLLERGEVDICVQHDGEVFPQMNRGTAVDFSIGKSASPSIRKSRRSARVRAMSKSSWPMPTSTAPAAPRSRSDTRRSLPPPNRNAVIPENLASKSVTNDALAWKACGTRTGTGISKTSRRSSKPSTRSSV